MTQETPNEVQKIEPPEGAQTLISGLLPLVDSEYKKFAVDIYAIQLAKALFRVSIDISCRASI